MSKQATEFFLKVCGGEAQARELWLMSPLGRTMSFEQFMVEMAKPDRDGTSRASSTQPR